MSLDAALSGGSVEYHTWQVCEATGSGYDNCWERTANGAPERSLTVPYHFSACRAYRITLVWKHTSTLCPGHTLVTATTIEGVNPPPLLEAWWTGDSTAQNHAGSYHHGTWMQDTATPASSPSYAAGKFGRAFDIDGGPEFVEVPDHDGLDFGVPGNPIDGEDFSIDAWVNVSAADPDARQPIVNKLRCFSNSSFVPGPCLPIGPGYSFEMLTDSGELKLTLALTDGVYFTGALSAPFDLAGNGYGWHFVAVTVDRQNPGGIRFYVDGVDIGCASGCTVNAGSLANDLALRIGADRDQFVGDDPFRIHQGRIDEVEFFRQEISPTQVAALYAAKCGKCRGRFKVAVPSKRYVCAGETPEISSIVKVCNEWEVGQRMYVMGDPAIGIDNDFLPGICNASNFLALEDISFRENYNSTHGETPYGLDVEAGACPGVVADIDTSSLVGAGQTLCFGVWADAASGDGWAYDVGVIEGVDCSNGVPVFPATPEELEAATFSAVTGGSTPPWLVENNTGGVLSIDYRLESAAIGRDESPNGMSLGGLPEGDAWEGTLVLADGASTTLSTTATLLEYRPEDLYRLTLSLDPGQDGTFELATDQLLEPVLPRAVCPEHFDHTADRVVDGADYNEIAAKLGTVNGDLLFDGRLDHDRDEQIDADDLALLQVCIDALAGIVTPGSTPLIGPIPNRDDLDADGVDNPVDNCPNVFNPAQLDFDADGTGDDCEAGASSEIAWVLIGDSPNSADATGFGSVDQDFHIGKLEVTNAQYAAFLNAVAADDTFGLFNDLMGMDPSGGIARSGSAGSYTYSARPGWGNRPVNYVSFWDTLRFANWLGNGRPMGAQGPTTTESGAYTLTAQAIADNSVTRNPWATVFVPDEDEWYKAAYYDSGGVYFDYPTGSDTAPACTVPGSTPDTANCFFAVLASTEVGAYTGSESAGRTNDQGGNLWEWNESVMPSDQRALRGGSYLDGVFELAATTPQGSAPPAIEAPHVGFRVARGCIPVPEPDVPTGFAAGVLLLTWLAKRRRRVALAREGIRGGTNGAQGRA